MKKRNLVRCVLVGIPIACFIFFCFFVYLMYDDWFADTPISELDLRFQQNIEKAVKSGAVIQLKDYTDFEWDRVCIAGIYASPEEIESRLGFRYEDYYKYHHERDDGLWWLLFVNEKKQSVTTVRIKRLPLSYFQYKKGFCKPKTVARFVVTECKERGGDMNVILILMNKVSRTGRQI